MLSNHKLELDIRLKNKAIKRSYWNPSPLNLNNI